MMAGDDEEREIAHNLWRQFRMLPPVSQNQRRWATFLRCCFVVNIFMVPVDVCFYHSSLRGFRQNVADPIDWVIDCLFFLDFLLVFRTSCRDPETNQLVTDWRVLAKRYLDGYAAPDFVSCLPWTAMTDVRALKFLKLLRATHLWRLTARETGKNVNMRRVLRVINNFIILSHWVACMWWFIGAAETDAGLFEAADLDGSGSITLTEFTSSVGAPSLLSINQSRAIFRERDANGNSRLDNDELALALDADWPALHPFALRSYSESWLQRIPLTRWNGPLALTLHKHSPFAQQYFSSLYWSFTALVKVPWITPKTVPEMIFSAVVVVTGAVFFAWLLGSIVGAIAAVERSNAQRRDKMTLMHNFSATRHLSSSLKSGMTRYVDAMFSFNNDVEGTEKLGQLPSKLRGELIELIYSPMLKSCPLFQIAKRETALLICQYLQPQVCLAKSVLVASMAIATHLFFLHRGALHVTSGQKGEEEDEGKGPHYRGKKQLRVRVCERMGSFVGIYDPYSYTARLPIEVTAVKLTQLFAIQRHELIEVVEGVGELEAEILLRALAAEQKTVVDALKFGRETSRKGEPGGSRRESKRFDDEDEGGEVEEGQKASRLLRRRSKADAAVGNLLTAGSIHGKTQSVGAAGGEAVTATLHLWDDAVDAVKSSTSALEETSKNYRKEVFGFCKGMSQAEELLAALQLIPEAERPKAEPDGNGSFKVARVNLMLPPSPNLPQPESNDLPEPEGLISSSEQPMDSGSRLFTHMFSGFGFKPVEDIPVAAPATSARSGDSGRAADATAKLYSLPADLSERNLTA